MNGPLTICSPAHWKRYKSELNTGLTVYDTQNSMQVGDTVTMQIGGQPVEIQITGLLSTSPFNNTGDSGIIIVSEDTFRQITGEEKLYHH